MVVLASGTGSLLQALLDAAIGSYPARVVAVGVDRDCPAAMIAAAAGVPWYRVRLRDHADRRGWDAAIAGATAERRPDLVVVRRIHETARTSVSFPIPRQGDQHIPRCYRRFRAPMPSGTRWTTG